MKYYDNQNGNFFIEKPDNWEVCCRYPADKTWKEGKRLRPNGTILYYRDVFGAEKNRIEDKDLYFPCWPKTRLNPGACLNVYWALGQRFIKLEQAKPLGFKCAPFPMNLREVNKRKMEIAKEKEKAARDAWLHKMLLTECKKHSKKGGQRGAQKVKSVVEEKK